MDAWIEAFELGFILVFLSLSLYLPAYIISSPFPSHSHPFPIFPLHFLIHSHVPFSNQIERPSTCESR